MNIHEHQAKQILKKYGVAVPNGVFGLTVEELIEKSKSLKTNKSVSYTHLTLPTIYSV